jgi:tetratricopeptide (TPR) repeat protein
MRKIFLLTIALIPASLLGAQAQTQTQTRRPATELQTEEQTRATTRAVSPAAQASPALVAQPPAAAVKAAVSQRNYEEAVRLSRAATDAAIQSGNRQAAADLQMDHARIIQQWVTEDSSQTARLNDAATAYRDVIQRGNPLQQTLARNYLGEVLLKQGKASEAVQAFQTMDLSTVDASKRHILQYNLGRALEVSGDDRAAYDKYSAIVLSQPAFTLAAERSFDILQKATPPRVAEVVRLSSALLKSGEIETASSRLKGFLKSWGGQPDAAAMLVPLVRYYTIQAYSPRAFGQVEGPFLAELQRTAPALARPVAEIRRVYEGPLTPVFSSGQARSSFPSWTDTADKRDAFAALLTAVGNQFNREKGPQEALARLSAAWMIEPSRTDGAVELAATLRANRNLRFGPNSQLFDQLIDGLFETKGQAYAGNDWPNILRLHVVLANIFEEDRNWGSSTNSRSAIFQWEHAIEAERRVRAADAAFSPSPGLHMHLASCYRAVGRSADALTEYVNAGEAFMRDGDKSGAMASLQGLRALNVQIAPGLRSRVTAIENFTN